MKANKFVELLRKVISEEVKKAIRSELTELLTERTPARSNGSRRRVTNRTVEAEKKNFASDPMLNDILNETANDYNPSTAEEWPTMNGRGYNKSDLASMMGVGATSAEPTVQNMAPAGMNPAAVPKEVASALTRDYSGLMKAISKKKGL